MNATERVVAAHYATGERFAFSFKRDALLGRERTREPTDLLFGPGFLDLQCNGYAGVDFNNPDISPREFAGGDPRDVAARLHLGAADGDHAYPGADRAALSRKLGAALDERPGRCAASVPGFHLEGPFLSPEEGARGAHPLSAISPVIRRWWRRWQRAARRGASAW